MFPLTASSRFFFVLSPFLRRDLEENKSAPSALLPFLALSLSVCVWSWRMDSGFRDELAPFLGSRVERRKILKEIIGVERDELGVPPVPAEITAARSHSQMAHVKRISRPKLTPLKTFINFQRAPRSLRSRGMRSPDELFSAGEGEAPQSFWLYDSQKVSQSTLGALANQTRVTYDELMKAPVVGIIRQRLDSLLEQAKQKARCGLLFDIISTSKIINSGIPHEIGAFIYDYIQEKHYDVTSLKFVFVGITDNLNCCAARDVFCRDEVLQGKYIGDTKRSFEALDNVHMFSVFPGSHRLSRARASDAPPLHSEGTSPSPDVKAVNSGESGGLPSPPPQSAATGKKKRLSAAGAFVGSGSAAVKALRPATRGTPSPSAGPPGATFFMTEATLPPRPASVL